MDNTTNINHKKKINGYSSATLHAKRDAKRQEAKARQREHDGLTLKERLDKARSRPGESKREVKRLLAAMNPPKQKK